MKNSTLFLLMLLGSTASIAQPGTLDSTFGRDGKVKMNIEAQRGGGQSVSIQTDGKIVVGGISTKKNGSQDFAVERFMPDGNLDSAFGINGITVTNFGEDFQDESTDEGRSSAIQTNGKIVVAGYTELGGEFDFALVRYKKNGQTDSTFGTNGKVTTDFENQFDVGYSVAIQADGKIVVTGYSGFDLALARYKENGQLDKSFGKEGKVTTDFGNLEEGNAVTIQANGKIIVGGFTGEYPGRKFLLVRYKPNGDLDSSFGKNGKVLTAFADYAYCNSVAIKADGKIVAAGTTFVVNEFSDFALAQYKPNGDLDSAFGTNGKVTTAFFLAECHSVAVQENGKIVAAGSAVNELNNFVFALARYKRDGQLDKTFGTNGKVVTNFSNRDAATYSVAIQVDGKIVGAGFAGGSFAVARYIGDSTSLDRSNNNFSNLRKQNSNTSTNIYLSPNPVKDVFHIEGLSRSQKTISIIDAKAKLLQQTTTANGSYSFNVKQLPAGIYFIRIDEGDKSTTLRFIKE